MIQSVQWRGWGWSWGWGAPAVAGGIVAGALIGSALAAPYYYGPYYYPYYAHPYYAPATLSCGDKGALGPPISVLTHPGLSKTQVMPRGAKSIAELRITIFTAALELR
jgi:hypothetical protein